MTRARYSYKGEAIARHPALGARAFVVVFCQNRRLARAQVNEPSGRLAVYPLASQSAPPLEPHGAPVHVPCRRHPDGHDLDPAELERLAREAERRHGQISVSVSRVSRIDR